MSIFIGFHAIIFRLLAENCEFSLPHSHLTPSLGLNLFEFLDELFVAKTRVPGEDFVILGCVVLTQCQRVTDGRTDRQTDGRTDGQTDNPPVGNRGLCVASYADAL